MVPPALDQAQQEELKGAVEQPPAQAGIHVLFGAERLVELAATARVYFPPTIEEIAEEVELVMPGVGGSGAGRDGPAGPPGDHPARRRGEHHHVGRHPGLGRATIRPGGDPGLIIVGGRVAGGLLLAGRLPGLVDPAQGVPEQQGQVLTERTVLSGRPAAWRSRCGAGRSKR